MTREAVHDDVIPLSKPIQSKSGNTISEIPICAGQSVLISVCAYNRLVDVWGEDAQEFNPRRWIDNSTEKEVKVGVYSNL